MLFFELQQLMSAFHVGMGEEKTCGCWAANPLIRAHDQLLEATRSQRPAQ